MGWQYGEPPAPPRNIGDLAAAAWRTWMTAWWAAFWTPEDIPGLILTVKLFDLAVGEEGNAAEDTVVTKLTPLLDRYGITPKGRQSLRWAPPETEGWFAANEPPPSDKSASGPDDLQVRRSARRNRLA